MNKETRTRLDGIKVKLDDLRVELESIRDAEQEKYDNLPDALQCGQQGDKLTEAVDNLESAIGDMQTAAESIEAAAS